MKNLNPIKIDRGTKDCHEYTLPRSDESSQPEGWIQGNTRIGTVLEITTCYMYGKHGIEIRIWSLSEDNSQSWVRISHGSNKFVIDSNYYNTEVLADLPEDRSKAKAKPQRREPVDCSPSIIPMNERKWIGIEPEESSLRVRGLEESNSSSSTLSNYNEKTTEQFNSGGSRIFIRINIHKSLFGRMIVGKHARQQEEE